MITEINLSTYYLLKSEIEACFGEGTAQAIKNEIDTKADINHTHDDEYYTISEINNQIDGHNHDTRYYTKTETDNKITPLTSENSTIKNAHTHDDRYYTETEIDNKLTEKAPYSHEQNTETITSNQTYENLGTNLTNQKLINKAINDQIGTLKGIKFIEIVDEKPTASEETMNKLYIVSENNKVNVYYTKKNNNTYTLTKMDENILDELEITWERVTGKPNKFPPETHNHNDIYFTETEIEGLLVNKSDKDHDHDTRYYTETEIDGLLNEKENVSNKTNLWNNETNNTRYPTEQLVKNSLDEKADINHSTPHASGSIFGHVKLSNTYDSSEGAANNGLGASQAALATVYNKLTSQNFSLKNGHDHDTEYILSNVNNFVNLSNKSGSTVVTQTKINEDIDGFISNINTSLAGKANEIHNHSLSDITANAFYQTIINVGDYTDEFGRQLEVPIEIDKENIPITVILKDFNGNRVPNTEVTIRCNKGVFTQKIDKNGTTSINNMQWYTCTTTEQGKCELLYTANEWGNVKFKANETTQIIHVGGWKKYLGQLGTAHAYSDSTKVEYYRNNNTCICYAYIKPTENLTNPTNSDTDWYVCNVPEECRPKTTVFSTSYYCHDINTPSNRAQGYLKLTTGDTDSITNLDIVLRQGSTYLKPEVRLRFVYNLD